ncbi:methyltransferase, partial [candidate division MSBL1 archaeon SCGC-AAA259E17]
QGDQHDIGKNLAVMIFKGAGYRVKDLGTDVSPEEVVEAVKEFDADVVGLSALLTTTMEVQRDVIEALEADGVRDEVLVAVGGAPVTQEYAEDIGADVYGASPFEALNKLENIL